MPKMSPECCLRLEKSPLPLLTLRQLYLPYFDKQCVVFEKIASLFLLLYIPVDHRNLFWN